MQWLTIGILVSEDLSLTGQEVCIPHTSECRGPMTTCFFRCSGASDPLGAVLVFDQFDGVCMF
jgi:hypothetical protein